MPTKSLDSAIDDPTLRRPMRIGLVTLGGLAALAIVRFAQLGAVPAPGSGIEQVSVSGYGRLNEAEVFAALGVDRGDHVLRDYDVRAAVQRLSALPGVADATVTRRLPNTLDVVLAVKPPSGERR